MDFTPAQDANFIRPTLGYRLGGVFLDFISYARIILPHFSWLLYDYWDTTIRYQSSIQFLGGANGVSSLFPEFIFLLRTERQNNLQPQAPEEYLSACGYFFLWGSSISSLRNNPYI